MLVRSSPRADHMRELRTDHSLLLQTLSGRGDKDVQQISELLPQKWADKLDWGASCFHPLP